MTSIRRGLMPKVCTSGVKVKHTMAVFSMGPSMVSECWRVVAPATWGTSRMGQEAEWASMRRTPMSMLAGIMKTRVMTLEFITQMVARRGISESGPMAVSMAGEYRTLLMEAST